MKLNLIAVGHLKNSPEKILFDQYNKRLLQPLIVHEITNKKNFTKEEEGELIIKFLTSTDYMICLDEKGDNLTTQQFYNILNPSILADYKNCFFVIGGADGLSNKVKERSNLKISFGKMTWPHLLVRSLLIEQLYRCQQIKNNHPYHRE